MGKNEEKTIKEIFKSSIAQIKCRVIARFSETTATKKFKKLSSNNVTERQ